MRSAWAWAMGIACVAVLAAGCISVDVEKNEPGERKHSSMKGARGASGSEIPTGFINKTMSVGSAERPYVVYVPREYDPAQAWPLIVFLHGAGERGDNGLAQTEIGLGRALRFWPHRFPCLVVMPQCPPGVWWDGAVADIDTALADTLRDYSVDPDRVYLTGLSMGGYASWQYGAAHADRFAAIMPICGGGNPADADKLAAVPIWAFHGAKDDVVPVAETRKMVEAVRKAGGDVQYTEYPDLNHNSWDAAYSEAKAARWLLEQRKDRK